MAENSFYSDEAFYALFPKIKIMESSSKRLLRSVFDIGCFTEFYFDRLCVCFTFCFAGVVPF